MVKLLLAREVDCPLRVYRRPEYHDDGREELQAQEVLQDVFVFGWLKRGQGMGFGHVGFQRAQGGCCIQQLGMDVMMDTGCL